MRRVLVVGSGGVGAAIGMIARHRGFIERMVLADVDGARAAGAAGKTGDDRFGHVQLDASDADAIVALTQHEKAEVIVNACDPRLNPPIFEAALTAGVPYLDMAMTLSQPHPERPYELPGVMLGDAQFAADDQWRAKGLLALVGMGVEPGMSDVFARHAADHLFTEIDEVGVRDGADLAISDHGFAPTFSIWTTIEECLNPPLIWEREKGFYTTAPFSQPEMFEFPAGIGRIECVNVEHEEVVLVPRWVDCKRVTFKYGLGEEFIAVLEMLHKLGLDSTDPVDVRGAKVAPRDMLAALLPDPATLGHAMEGRTCAGTLVTGAGKDGSARAVYLHHIVDNAETMAKDDSQAVVWQTALHPVIALELLAEGVWTGAGVLGPEAFPARPFLDAMADYGSPPALDERDPGNPLAVGRPAQ